MKTIEIKNERKKQRKKTTGKENEPEMTANMQDYNKPHLPRYIMGGKGGGMQS